VTSTGMAEFEVRIVTVRSGSHTVHLAAEDAATARAVVQAECDAGANHCPPEWCTDAVESAVAHVRQIEHASHRTAPDRSNSHA
jgi:hypothetical protein